MKLIVGLGNPGRNYKGTRHNAGFMAVEHLAKKGEFDEFKLSEKHKAEIAEGFIAGEKTLLVKPQTFMNLSGQSVSGLMNFYKLRPDDLIVIYDDVDLPTGSLRIRPDGSAGGHKGMKSIIELLGSQNFTRIRLGIHPSAPFKGALEDYVLGKLTVEEKKALKASIKKLPELIETWLTEGTEAAMNRFN